MHVLEILHRIADYRETGSEGLIANSNGRIHRRPEFQ